MKAKNLFYMARSVLLYLITYIAVALIVSLTPLGTAGGGMYLVAVVMLACGIVVFFTIKKGEFEILSKEKARPVWLMMVSIILLSLGVTVFLNRLMEYVPWELFPGGHVEQDNETLFGIPVFWRMVIYVGIAPLSEELLFRGAVFARLRKVIPVWAAVLISALMFGVYHLNWMQGIYAVIMGSIMAVLFHRFDSFLGALLFHMAANFWVNLAMAAPKWNDFLGTPAGLVSSVILSILGAGLVWVHGKGIKGKDKR